MVISEELRKVTNEVIPGVEGEKVASRCGFENGGSVEEVPRTRVKKSELYSYLCWNCSKEKGEVARLYKCGGCKTARYCGKECRDEDREAHGTWCEKKQEKRRRREEARKAGSSQR